MVSWTFATATLLLGCEFPDPAFGGNTIIVNTASTRFYCSDIRMKCSLLKNNRLKTDEV